MGAVVVGVAISAFALIGAGEGAADNIAGLPRATVERGPMTVTISEDGEIEAEEQQVIRNELRWGAIITELFAEGTIIQKGQTAIRFECEKLVEAIEEQELRVQSSDNEHRSAVTSYDIKTLDLDARVRKAGYAVEDAKANLVKYQEAGWKQLQAEAKSSIDQASGDLKLAKHKLTSKQKINEDPELNRPYSQNEIDAEELTVARLTRSLERAVTDRYILLRYTHPRKLRNFQSDVEDAERELGAAKAEREKQLNLAKTQKETKAFRLKNAKENLADLIEDRDKYLDVKAEQTGLVVYETRGRRWHRPITVAVEEEISPRQQVIVIPDSSTLVVKSRVYESVREKVSVGLPARIRLDARAGKALHGTVSKVHFLPDSQNPWLSPGVKVYPTTVTFNDDVASLNLKPGMTCDIVITLAELPDVLSVPIAAVFSDQDTTFCHLVGPDGRARRAQVVLGMTSETRAEIKSGLKAEDIVLLVSPPGERLYRRPIDKKTPSSRPAAKRPRRGPAGPAAGATSRPAPTTPDGTPRRPRRGRRTGGGGRRGDG